MMPDTLPSLWREDMLAQKASSLCSTSDLNKASDRERQISYGKNRQNPDLVQRRFNSATSRRRMDSEDKASDIFKEKCEVENLFPMKAVCHKRAFNLNNCQPNNYFFTQKDLKGLDYLERDRGKGKQTSNKRQEKQYLSKFELSDTLSYEPSWKRDETYGKSSRTYQPTYKDQYGRAINESQLTEEIHRKEVILQEKLLKTVEHMRKTQQGNGSRDKVKREERNKDTRGENALFFPEKEERDWRSTKERERTIGDRKDEGQRERARNSERSNRDDRERWGNHKMETEESYRERRREGIEWEDSKRNTQSWDNYGEITTWERAREVKDKIKRERATERARNEMREWDIKLGNVRDCKEKERVNYIERRSERVKPDKFVEQKYQDEQWDGMDSFKSYSQTKIFSKHDTTNGLTADRHPTQERLLWQHQMMVERETKGDIRTSEQPTERAHQSPPLSQKYTGLRHVELSPEKGSDAHVQLVPCNICQRCFTNDRLERHSRVCEKQQQSKRKVFDSAHFRAKGTDLEAFMKTNSRPMSPEVKKNNWRQKHEAFIHNMRQARAPAPGGLQPQANADVNPDYISCPHCGRRFAPGPAERHIPKCQTIKSRPPPPPRHRR
ncbi:zinc finger C2HC domain-containing protein 1C isoform X2 [Hoplias malabaricus]